MFSAEYRGLSEAVHQPPVFAELVELVCAGIVATGQQETTRGEIVDAHEPRSLSVRDYDVPNGYGEGSDIRIAMAAYYAVWGGMGDDRTIAKKVVAIQLTLGLAEPGVAEPIVVELSAKDFEFGRMHEADAELVRMAARVLGLSKQEPTDADLMPLTDARIDRYRDTVRKLCEKQNRAEAERMLAARAALAPPAVQLSITEFSQPDYSAEHVDVSPKVVMSEDPDIAENKRITTLAARATVDNNGAAATSENAAMPNERCPQIENNGYSVENFVSDCDARELANWQRNLIIELCLAIDAEKLPSYRRGFRPAPDTTRFVTPYMVRTALEQLPAGPEARDIEIFLTSEAKKQTAATHPDWFDSDLSLPPGYPTLYWLEEVGDRVLVGTTARAIPSFPTERFSSPGEARYLMNIVHSDIIGEMNKLFS